MADYLCQFFANPTLGVIINAFLLALIALEMGRYLSRIARSNRLIILTFLPTLALFFVQTRNNYLYEGTIGFLLMLICLNLRQKIENIYLRRTYTLFISLFLYWAAGPIAMLYALTILVSRFSPFAFFPFVLAFLFGGISQRLGHHGELMHLLSPEGFFTVGVAVNKTMAWLPWILWLIILAIGLTIRHFVIPQWITRHLVLIQVFLAVAYAATGVNVFIDHKNEYFKELQTLSRNDDWKGIVKS